jgi:succinyl-CoA synthetase beta subunit
MSESFSLYKLHLDIVYAELPSPANPEGFLLAHRSIREFDSKKILASLLPKLSQYRCDVDKRILKVDASTNLEQVNQTHPWLEEVPLVVKVDQLVKRRMKNGLVNLNVSWQDAKSWIKTKLRQQAVIEGISGQLEAFIVEPFQLHPSDTEYYCAIRTGRNGDEILFSVDGGIDVGEVEKKSRRIFIAIEEELEISKLENELLKDLEPAKRELVAVYLQAVYKIFIAADFVFLEINPLTIIDGRVVALDLAVRVDDTASQEAKQLWGPLAFPPAFGRVSTEEEEFIRSLDENSGASLKLTILNPAGRIWTLLAGGGASVVFTDTIVDLGFGAELANYGEYSGNPTDEETYEYAKTVLNLMTRSADSQGRGKILIIGGGIANFTDVAKTFGGISKALQEEKAALKKVGVKIFVRRGGPNYKEAIRKMKLMAPELGVPFEVYGPETPMTRIVKLALVKELSNA